MTESKARPARATGRAMEGSKTSTKVKVEVEGTALPRHVGETAFDRLRDALVGAGRRVDTRGPRRFVAQCPSHDDRHPSLNVTGVDGQVLVYCHAGCDTIAEVLPALRLRAPDLYDNPRGTQYRYPDGRVVHRTPDKQFRQSGNTNGTALYNLDAVRVAVAAGEPVYVVEGEKDAQALAVVGAAATCSAMGAGKADKFDWRPLRGATVRVVADRDEPGRKHATQVRAILADLGCTIVMLEAATGHDAADHIAAGRGLDEFTPVEIEEPEPSPAMQRLSDVDPERVEWLWPGRFPTGKLVLLDGDPSLGKSTLALTFAAHVSTGKPWPDDESCSLGDVIVMSAEDGLADTIRPRLDAAEGDPARVHALTAVPTVTEDGEVRYRPPTLADTTYLRRAIKQTRARLLIVDVLMAYLPGKVDSHRDQDVRTVLHQLAAVADEARCTVLLLRHLNKASGGNPLYRGGGSIGIVGAARAGFLVAKDPEDDARQVLACTKSNLAATPPSLTYTVVADPDTQAARIEWGGSSPHAAAALLADPGSDDERSERDEAAEWLTAYLIDEGRAGVAKAGEVIKAAARDGIPKTTLTRARKRAGVTTEKAGFGGGWLWRIREPVDQPDPRRDHEGTEEPSAQELSPSVPSVDSSATPEGHADHKPCDRCQGTPTHVNSAGARLCRRCAPSLWPDAA